MDIDRHRNSKARKAQRRADALTRNKLAAELSPTARLTMLDNAFGVGQGAKRERERLAKRLAKRLQKAAQAPAPEPKAEPPKRERRARKGAK